MGSGSVWTSPSPAWLTLNQSEGVGSSLGLLMSLHCASQQSYLLGCTVLLGSLTWLALRVQDAQHQTDESSPNPACRGASC